MFKKYVHHYSTIIFSDKEYYDLGAPFFFAFHTLFDGDNEQIQVCPNDPSFLEKVEDKKDDRGTGEDKKDDKGMDNGKGNGDKKDKSKWLIIVGIAAGIILLIIITFIICCCYKSKNAKEEENLEKSVNNEDPIIDFIL